MIEESAQTELANRPKRSIVAVVVFTALISASLGAGVVVMTGRTTSVPTPIELVDGTFNFEKKAIGLSDGTYVRLKVTIEYRAEKDFDWDRLQPQLERAVAKGIRVHDRAFYLSPGAFDRTESMIRAAVVDVLRGAGTGTHELGKVILSELNPMR